MPNKIDLVNKRFGELLVISQADNIKTPNGRSHVAWNCLCTCGERIVVRGDALRNGHTISCKCVNRATRRQAGIDRKKNLVGMTFGYLTVLEDSNMRASDGSIIWKCRCACGNIVHVSAGNLARKKSGTLSCGCKKSKGEKKISDLLRSSNIDFIAQKSFVGCVFPKSRRQAVFDFYLPTYNLLIEYDGEQHFHKVKNDRYNYKVLCERDKFKDSWCLANNIRLIRIPYTDYDILDVAYIKRIIG